MDDARPILLVGIPRSGSSWAGKVLSQSEGWCYVHEPDNEKLNPLALISKRNLHRYPYLPEDVLHRGYSDLWKMIFSGMTIPSGLPGEPIKYVMPPQKVLESQITKKCGSRSEPSFSKHDGDDLTQKKETDLIGKFQGNEYVLGNLAKYLLSVRRDKRIVVKSVHTGLSLPWIEKHFSPKIVIILRNPLNVIASYLRMRMPDSRRNIFNQQPLLDDYLPEFGDVIQPHTNRVQQMAAQIGSIYKVIEEQLESHPEWILIRHEMLCEDPLGEFRRLYDLLGLKWNSKVEGFIQASNKQGEGFVTNRIAKAEIHKWKNELTPIQVRDIEEVIGAFNLISYPF